MVRPERFELPTPCFVGKCSIQLSYGRILRNNSITDARGERIFRSIVHRRSRTVNHSTSFRGKGPAPVNRRYSPRCPSDVPREGYADTCVINESHLSVGLPSAVFPAKAVICHAKRHGVGNDTEMGMEGKSSIPLNRPRVNFRL